MNKFHMLVAEQYAQVWVTCRSQFTPFIWVPVIELRLSCVEASAFVL